MRWWTFAGWKANLHLARLVEPLREEVAALDDLTIALDGRATGSDVVALLRDGQRELDVAPWITADAVEGLKFSDCLPRPLAQEVVARRLADPSSVTQVRKEQVAGWAEGSPG